MGKKNTAIEATDVIKGVGLLATEVFLHYDLSRRQCQIAYRLFQGYSGNLIAKKLYLTTSCIRYHISIIYSKTHSKNREDFLHTVWQRMRLSQTKWDSSHDIHKACTEYFVDSGEWSLK